MSEIIKQPEMKTGNAVMAFVPQNYEEAWRIANTISKSGMAPKDLGTPEKVMVCIMHGQEVGFTPMAALQSIAVINGRPTIWGDGALGLVQGSGKLEWIKEFYEGEGDTLTAHCHVKRANDVEIKKASFSTADAKAAGLLGKAGPWTQYRPRMLKMRARSWALRDGFSDVLKGLSVREEVEDYVNLKPDQVDHTVVASEPARQEIKMPSVKPATVEVKPAAQPAIEHAPGMVYMDVVTKVNQQDTPQGVYYGIQTKAHGNKFLGTFDAKAAEIATAVIGGPDIEIVYAIEGKYMKLVRIGPEVQEEAQAEAVEAVDEQEPAAE